jgi:hypothetical protein
MYAWIWRALPFGLPGKITGSLVLFAAMVSLLWFWVFPAISPWLEDYLLPFDQSTIEGPGAGTGPSAEVDDSNPALDDGLVGPDGEPIDEHDIPYDTED